MSVSPWPEADERFLRESAATMTLAEIARALGRNYEAVRSYARTRRIHCLNKLTNPPGNHLNGWTEDRLAEAIKLHREGHSAGQIAKALGGGISRNAVTGKLHRHGLSRTPEQIARLRNEGARRGHQIMRDKGLAANGRAYKAPKPPRPTRAAPYRPPRPQVADRPFLAPASPPPVAIMVAAPIITPDSAPTRGTFRATPFLDLDTRKQCGWHMGGDDWCAEPKEGHFCAGHRIKGINHDIKPFRGFSDGGRGPRAPRADNPALAAWGADW